MGVMDFIFGKGNQTSMEPAMKEARNFILNQMMKQYLAGPVNIPKYFAPLDQARYSGTNNLLSSLGLDTVAAPSMQTENINGMNVYSSEPMQTELEANFAEKYPAQYEYLKSMYMDPVTGARTPTASFSPYSGGGSGGGGSSRDDGASGIPVNTGTNYAANADPSNSLGLVNKDGTSQTFDILGYGQNDNNDVVALGYGAGMVDPSLASAAGYSYRDDNPYDYSLGDHFSAMANDVSNIRSNAVNDIVSLFTNDNKKDEEKDDTGFLGIF